MSKEAMKLALEAMERYQVISALLENDRFADEIIALQKALAEQPPQAPDIQRHNDYTAGFTEGYSRAEKNAAAQLAQPLQKEPAEWLTGCPECGMDSCDCDEGTYNPPAQQEPVAWLSTDSIGERYLCFDKPLDDDLLQPLYESPPAQRTWVGLTDEEHMVLYTKADSGLHDWARAIEAKLKEKNT